jgi:hypothetical protein
MLIHIEPRFYHPMVFTDVALVDVFIPELDLRLVGGVDVVARKPYPNRNYLVACRRVGQKAAAGILVDTPTWLASFTAVTTWRIDDADNVVHRVCYTVTDSTFDAVSEHMTLWGATRTHESRWPTQNEERMAPLHYQPCMELQPGLDRRGVYQDTVDEANWIVERVEWFKLPSIERSRLTTPIATSLRIPPVDHAFAQNPYAAIGATP